VPFLKIKFILKLNISFLHHKQLLTTI